MSRHDSEPRGLKHPVDPAIRRERFDAEQRAKREKGTQVAFQQGRRAGIEEALRALRTAAEIKP